MPNPIEDYVTQNRPYAEQVEQKYGVPTAVTLAAGGIESGWGKQVVGGNLFGIKGTGTKTTDAQTGQPIEQRTYGSAEETVLALRRRSPCWPTMCNLLFTIVGPACYTRAAA